MGCPLCTSCFCGTNNSPHPSHSNPSSSSYPTQDTQLVQFNNNKKIFLDEWNSQQLPVPSVGWFWESKNWQTPNDNMAFQLFIKDYRESKAKREIPIAQRPGIGGGVEGVKSGIVSEVVCI